MYYYLASVSKDQIEVLRDSNEHEYAEICEFQSQLSNITQNNRRFNMVQKAFDRISQINKSLLLSQKSHSVEDLSEAVSEYLFAFRKFLDNWETHIKREYGDDSALYKLFKKATAEAYDENIEYEIIYQLRNAGQHCDRIITSIALRELADGSRCIEALAQSDYLLKVYSRWKASEKDYLLKNDKIDIFAFVSKTQKCLQQIHLKLINFFCTAKLYDACSSIVEKANEYPDKREFLCFLCQQEEMTKEFWQRPTKELNTHAWMVKESISFLEMFIRNNLSAAAVFYYGKQYSQTLGHVATELTEGQISGVEVGMLLNVDGERYRCYTLMKDLTNNSTIIIAINTAIARKQQSELSGHFSRYIEALIGRKQSKFT